MKNVISVSTSMEPKSYVAQAIHCLAASGVTGWKTAYERQITNAKELGLMPDDLNVLNKTLQYFGLKMQSTAVEGIQVSKAISLLGPFSEPVVIFFSIGNDYMMAIQIDADNCIPIIPWIYSGDFNKLVVSHAWIRWNDGVDRSQYHRRATKHNSKKVVHQNHFIETLYFKPFQPNPCNNNIGDCVVRATSGAMNISWCEAMTILSSTGNVTINTKDVYQKVLEKNGFIHHNPIIRNRQRLSGKDFCEEMNKTYRNGERIFAHVGRSHVAAVVPVSIDDKMASYKIIDSWDSSNRLIGEYWVLPTAAIDVVSTKSKPIFDQENQKHFKVGTQLHHPTFGNGVITKIASGALVVDFRENGMRKLDGTWVQNHCSITDHA